MKMARNFKAVLSLVLSVAVFATTFMGLALNTTALSTTEINDSIYFVDDFNRDALADENSGWVAQYTGDAANYEIADGVLQLKDASGENFRGYANGLVMRPISEAAVNQKASVEISNLVTMPKDFASVNLHLRLLGTEVKTFGFKINNTMDSENWTNMSYYASVNNSVLQVSKVEIRRNSAIANKYDRISTTLTTENFEIYADHTYKLEFTAEGTYPTTLTATLYDMTTETVAASVNCTDNTYALQTAGTAALSSCGGGAGFKDDRKIAYFDNFEYRQLSSNGYYDDFNRTEISTNDDGSSNGWVVQKTGDNKIGNLSGETDGQSFAGVLRVVHTGTNGYSQNVIMRPMTEASVDSKASVTFSNMGHFYSGGFSYANVHLRITDTNATNVTSYYASVNSNYLKICRSEANGNTVTIATSASKSFGGNDKYRLELEATGTYPTTLTAKLYKVTSNELIETVTATDITAALQQAGTAGVSVTCNGAGHSRNSKFEEFSYEYANGYFDDFNRDTVAGNNSGWVENIAAAGGTSSNFMENGYIRIYDKTALGYTNNTVLRPMSEAAVNQTVSADLMNMGHIAYTDLTNSANVHVRVQGTDSKYTTSYYAAVSNTKLKIYSVVSTDGNTAPARTELASVNFTSVSIDVCRLQLKAEGTNPTVLTATLYNVTDKVAVATATCSDNTEALQTAGTAGISINGMTNNARTGSLDNFIYQSFDNEVATVDVDRDDDFDDNDATELRKKLIGYAPKFEGGLGYDSNEDGFVNICDLVTIDKRLSGVEESPLLSNTYYKLTKEHELNVAYFGGSITAGYGASSDTTCWRGLTNAYLKERFPDAKINAFNAAIGGTGTAYGIHRVVRDLRLESETERPDLVFIEFGVNDRLDGLDKATAKANMEYIIRTIYEYNPNADIVVVLTTAMDLYNWYSNDHWPQAKAHDEIASEYGLPFVKVGPMLWDYMNQEIKNQEIASDKQNDFRKIYLPDGVHPSDAGYAKYAEYMREFLDGILDTKIAPPKSLKTSYMPENPSNVLPDNPYSANFAGQEAVAGTAISEEGYLTSSTAGTSFTVTFEGTDLKMWHFSGPASGDIIVSVDGGAETTIELYRGSGNNKIFTLAEGLENTTHTVKITLTTSANHGGSSLDIRYMFISGSESRDGVTLGTATTE